MTPLAGEHLIPALSAISEFERIPAEMTVTSASNSVPLLSITFNEPFFQGHFPGAPIMPGVTMIEALAQTAAVMVGVSLGLVDKNLLIYFMSIDNCKFRHKVGPGDTLELRVKVLRGKIGSKVWKFSGTAYVEKEIAAEVEFTAMMELPTGV